MTFYRVRLSKYQKDRAVSYLRELLSAIQDGSQCASVEKSGERCCLRFERHSGAEGVMVSVVIMNGQKSTADRESSNVGSCCD